MNLKTNPLPNRCRKLEETEELGLTLLAFPSFLTFRCTCHVRPYLCHWLPAKGVLPSTTGTDTFHCRHNTSLWTPSTAVGWYPARPPKTIGSLLPSLTPTLPLLLPTTRVEDGGGRNMVEDRGTAEGPLGLHPQSEDLPPSHGPTSSVTPSWTGIWGGTDPTDVGLEVGGVLGFLDRNRLNPWSFPSYRNRPRVPDCFRS